MRIPRALGLAALAIAAFYWFAWIGVPLAVLTARAVGGGVPLFDPVLVRIAAFTFGQALLSSSLALVIGLPLGLAMGAFLAARAVRGAPGHTVARLAEALLTVPYGVPAIVAADAWVLWLGRSGILARWGWDLDWAYSLRAVVLAHVIYNVPWIALLVAQARRHVSVRELEAAASLGADAGARLRWIIFPKVRLAALSGWAQAQALCAMSFALVLLLGGGPPVETLETALYARVRFGAVDVPGAIACAIWELVVTLAPWIIVLMIGARSVAMRPGGASASARTRGRGKKASAVFALAAAAAFVLPYTVVLGPASLARWSDPEFLRAVAPSIGISLELATLTAVGTLVVSIAGVIAARFAGAWRPWAAGVLAAAFTASAGISVLVLGLGYWIAYSRWVDPFRGSLAAIVGLQAALFVPIAFRSLWPLALSPARRRLEAAMTLGAGPVRAFRYVEWPRWRPAVAGVLAVSAAGALGEFAAVSLFYSEDLVPVPLLLSRWMTQYRFEDSRALSALLFCLSGLIAAGLMIASGGGSARLDSTPPREGAPRVPIA